MADELTDEGPCTDCWDTGITIQTERVCSCGILEERHTPIDRDCPRERFDAPFTRPSTPPAVSDDLVEEMVRAAYAGWPLKVISQAASDASGLPIGSEIPYEKIGQMGGRPQWVATNSQRHPPPHPTPRTAGSGG